MIDKIKATLKVRGARGLFRAGLRRVFNLPIESYRYCKPLVRGKVGLEIGGPSKVFRGGAALPVYAEAARVDNCNFSNRTIWEGSLKEGTTFQFDDRRAAGHQYVAEATDLRQIDSSTYDFVISSHALEHIANPLQALGEWIRVLKQQGLLILIVPHKDGTFDHRRVTTTMAHLVEDLKQGTRESDMTHLDEILQWHDLTQDPEAGDFESFKERSKKNIENRCLHHHVFDTRIAVEMVHYVGLQILTVEAFRHANILVVAQKPALGKKPDNDQFRGMNTSASRYSPFPSDRQPPSEINHSSSNSLLLTPADRS